MFIEICNLDHTTMNRQYKRSRDSSYDEANVDSEFESDDDVDGNESVYAYSSDSDFEDDEGTGDEFELINGFCFDKATAPIHWKEISSTFTPRKQIPVFKQPETSGDENFDEIDVFSLLFPRSLYMWIADCTNERLKLLEMKTKKQYPKTDYQEIMLVIGVTLMMSYNRVPRMSMYWSKNKSLRNEAIASAISRDRFLLLASKLYFNTPEKPKGCQKTYYIDELLNCLKHTFSSARSEATFQSIDESMIKFKGRSAMKQFMKDKPVKRGIKGWCRADATTGYVCDMDVYKGKETEFLEGTLGERVVQKLCSTIRDPNVAIVTDRFFMSVLLQRTIPFACVGTVMTNRKHLPQLNAKLQRGESEGMCSDDGIIAYKWQDTKEVRVLSNCHNHIIETADRKQKDGSIKTFDCPQAIVFYNKFMAGVDKGDQYSTTYEVDRKSNKWWKRVYHRLLQITVSNAWIIFKQLKKEDLQLIDFLVPLAESLVEVGKNGTKNQRNINAGRPSKRKKFMVNITHQPVEAGSLRRCRHCALKKNQMRTEWLCNSCDVPLCVGCFVEYHK